jgi:hypothetical protein
MNRGAVERPVGTAVDQGPHERFLKPMMEKGIMKLAIAIAGFLAVTPLQSVALADGSAPSSHSGLVLAQAQIPSESYGSIRAMGDTNLTIAGNYVAEDLIDSSVLDPEGNEIGEVADLLVNNDQTVTHMLVEVGGFLGIGARNVALGIDEARVQRDVGEGREVVVAMTEDELRALTALEYRNESWQVAGR